jgi:uncharacterized Zn finger protein
MPTVAELADVEVLRKLASPEAYDWGVEASDREAVHIEEFGTERVTGTVADGSSREVELRIENGTLQWSCTCAEADPSLCRHGVAVAVETWRRTPPGSGSP